MAFKNYFPFHWSGVQQSPKTIHIFLYVYVLTNLNIDIFLYTYMHVHIYVCIAPPYMCTAERANTLNPPFCQAKNSRVLLLLL